VDRVFGRSRMGEFCYRCERFGRGSGGLGLPLAAAVWLEAMLDMIRLTGDVDLAGVEKTR